MKNITVIGAGTMGNGIAHVFAQNGFEVNLMDIDAEKLEKALNTISTNLDRQINKQMINEKEKEQTIKRLHTSMDIGEAVRNAELVVEAASEKLSLKLNLFRSLDSLAPVDCLLATNTSSLSITKIGASTQRPDKVIGMHFMNPVPVMKLVEVINGYGTAKSTTETINSICEKLGKIPVEANDYPGFVSNRILTPMINEAIYTLQEGVAKVEAIDTVMKLGMAHPMGPLQLADFIGLDVCLSILRVLQEGYGQPKYAPCPLLVNMVEGGFLGIKSGEGFYKYGTDGKITGVSTQFIR